MIGLPELRPSSEAGVARVHQSTGSDEHRRGVRVLVHAAEGAGHISNASFFLLITHTLIRSLNWIVNLESTTLACPHLPDTL